jgi:hypothetical protein
MGVGIDICSVWSKSERKCYCWLYMYVVLVLWYLFARLSRHLFPFPSSHPSTHSFSLWRAIGTRRTQIPSILPPHLFSYFSLLTYICMYLFERESRRKTWLLFFYLFLFSLCTYVDILVVFSSLSFKRNRKKEAAKPFKSKKHYSNSNLLYFCKMYIYLYSYSTT